MEDCQESTAAKQSTPTVYIVIQKYNLNYKSCLLKFANTQVCSKTNVGSKAMRCQQLYVVSYSLIKSYFSDAHISTFNSSLESRRPHSSKSVRIHHLAAMV